ncbi:MAG: hypothetical protein EBV15_11215, partial [Bacteroidetes bacterium]|nr:hypothetical protein [Bacteroidota bacterium]
MPTVDMNEATRGTSGTNTGTAYDMGCYEQACASGTYYVNDNATTNDIWVSAVGSNSNAGSTSLPFLTLGYALKNCGCPGNTIRVDAGTYSEDNLVVSTDATGNGLTIVGAGKTLTVFDCDVDAVTTERFMTINVDADNISITDLTVKDADISGNGSGFNLTTSGSITLQDLIIDNCDLSAAGNLGGGVYVGSTSTATIDRCTFRNNNTFNSSSSYGTCVYTAGTTTLQNCLLYDNSVLYTGDPTTGHIHNLTGTLNVRNTTITENTDASAWDYDGDVYVESGTANVTNCILYNNGGDDNVKRYAGTATITYSLYDDGVGGTVTTTPGNITNSSPVFANAASDDFSLTSSSPAKDAGTATNAPSVDINVESRPYGIGYDMGCYEYK